MIKKEPQRWSSADKHGLQHSSEAPFQAGNEKAKVGRWTSLPAAVRSERICRLSWGRRLSAASTSLGLIGLCGSTKAKYGGSRPEHLGSNSRRLSLMRR